MFRSKIENLLLIILATIFLSGCSLLKPSSREKAMDKERNEQKAAASEMKAMEKAHYKAQTRETRKMMKKSRKNAKKLNKVKMN